MRKDSDWFMLDLLAEIESRLGRKLSPEQRAQFEVVSKWMKPEDQHIEIMKFVAKLTGRQGTIFPDFDALYRRKEELDRGE